MLVVGSVNEDLVVRVLRLPGPGETVTGGSFGRHGGGKGANAAVAAARLGAEVRFIGAVGKDGLGATAVERLAHRGLDVSGVRRLGEVATGVALIVVDEAGENQIAVASGANGRLDGALVAEALGEAPLEGDGVLLANLEVSDGAILAGARAAAAAGWRFVLNPAPARLLAPELLELGPVLTPNRGEALALTGADGLEEAVSELAGLTGAPVLATLGPEGVDVCEGAIRVRLPALDVKAVDATGAGDVFNGVLAACLASGLELLESAARGAAAASLATATPGARGLEASAAEIEARAGEILAAAREAGP